MRTRVRMTLPAGREGRERGRKKEQENHTKGARYSHLAIIGLVRTSFPTLGGEQIFCRNGPQEEEAYVSYSFFSP